MDSDYLPPPAYSEQEFDQKISRATDISIITPSPRIDEDGWELYDPAAFDNLSAVPPDVKNLSTLSSSSNPKGASFDHHSITQPENDKSALNKLPTIVPLRIEKKSQPKYDHPYNAYAGPSSPLPHPPYDDSSYVASSTTSIPLYLNDNYDQEVATQERESASGSRSASPPSFEVQSSFLTYTSNIEPTAQENRQADAQRNALYDPYYQTTHPHSPRQSLPVEPPRHPVIVQERPASSYSPRPGTVYAPSGPQLQFNPSIAYGKSTQSKPTILMAPAPLPANAQYDPHSFYNSAVSAQMNPMPVRSLQGEVYPAPSYEIRQPQLYSNDVSPRNPQQFTGHNARQSVWQTPSPRPITNYSIPNSPRNAAVDMNRFSQYSNDPARGSMYRANQNEWYSPR